MIATSEWEKRKAARNECYRSGRGPLDLRRGADGRGSHSRTARFNPQGDVRTVGIRQRQEGDECGGSEVERFDIIFARKVKPNDRERKPDCYTRSE